MATVRLLLVEDNQDCLDLFTLILSEKYRVFGYRGALEAVAAVENARPDMVLLDIGMTPIDGIECLQAIRAMPAYRNVPAIALTGYARETERQTFQASGFQAVLAKPIESEGLLAAVDAIYRFSAGNATSDGSAVKSAA